MEREAEEFTARRNSNRLRPVVTSLTDLPVTFVPSHFHYDHVGNGAELRRRGATVIAGPGDAEGIELADWRTAPYAAGFKVPVCTVDRVVQDGEVIEAGGFRGAQFASDNHDLLSQMLDGLAFLAEKLFEQTPLDIVDVGCSLADVGVL